MMLKIAPRTGEHEGPKAVLLKVLLHRGGVDAVGVASVQGTLDGGGVGNWRAARLHGPILHDHSNAGRTTTFGWLPDVRDVEPHRVTRAEQDAEQQRETQRRNY